MMSSSPAFTESMVIVVDVVDAVHGATAAPALSSSHDAFPPIERLEIDVDVHAHTTADALLADVEAALHEMGCRLCVPRSAAALAAGHVLPAVAEVESAMQRARAEERHTVDVARPFLASDSMRMLSDAYITAIRRARQLASVSRSECRVDQQRVLPFPSNPAGSGSAAPVASAQVWSVVPRLVLPGISDEAAVAISASTAATSAASSRMLARDEATPSALLLAGAKDGPSLPGVYPSTSNLTISDSTPPPITHPHAAARGTAEERPFHSSAAAAAEEAVPLDSQPLAAAALGGNGAAVSSHGAHGGLTQMTPAGDGVAQPHHAGHSSPPTPVVALEDVDVSSFRRLQERSALTLARGDAGPYGDGGITAEELSRLQPTLPWAAVKTAIEMEVRLLQAQGVLTGGYDAAARGDAAEGGARDTARQQTRVRLRAEWLAAAAAETAALDAETGELRREAEKADVWRAALKGKLRIEIAELEAGEARFSAAVSERELLRQRVTQLEAQVAAAKAEERALLLLRGPQGSSPPSPPIADAAEAGGERRAAEAVGNAPGPTAQAGESGSTANSPAAAVAASERDRVAGRDAPLPDTAQPQQRPQQPPSSLSSSLSESPSSASTTDTTSSDSAIPLPNNSVAPLHYRGQALKHRDARTAASDAAGGRRKSGEGGDDRSRSGGDGGGDRSRPYRWSGRRESLTGTKSSHKKRTTLLSAPDGFVDAAVDNSAAAAEARSRSRLSIERSFLSPSLRDQVRAALASDDDTTAAADAASAESSASSDSDYVHQQEMRVTERRADYHRSEGRVREDDESEGRRSAPGASSVAAGQPPPRRRRYQRRAEVAVHEGPPTNSSRVSDRHSSFVNPSFPSSVTPLRTAPSTAFSPSPVLPASYGGAQHRHDSSIVTWPRQTDSLLHVSPAASLPASHVYDDPTLMRGERAERSSRLSAYGAVPARHSQASATEAPAVGELRAVTAALRRHLREPQSDPAEGHRLLQQVRELRHAMELQERQGYDRGVPDGADERGAARQRQSTASVSFLESRDDGVRRPRREAPAPTSALYDSYAS